MRFMCIVLILFENRFLICDRVAGQCSFNLLFKATGSKKLKKTLNGSFLFFYAHTIFSRIKTLGTCINFR